MKILIRIPGQGSDFEIENILPEDTIEQLKTVICERHPKAPRVDCQRLISGGKLLQNDQKISELNLSNESPIIHLVISEQVGRPPTPPPVVIPEPFAEPEAVIEDIPEAENQPVDEEGWITEELKEYFDIWDLSIRCYELNDTYKYLVPKLKIYKALIMANQKQRMTGVATSASTIGPAAAPVDNLPRQNVDRENAVVGAQGAVEDDGPQDWLDRFYSLFRLSLMLFIVYNYSSTERFFAVLVIAVSIMLYQGGYFRIQRRQRPDAPPGGENDGENAAREPDRPGVFRMIWVFLSQFIASLIPQNPAPVNAN